MLIDTHSHLNFKAFDDDRDEIIKKALANEVWLINASSNYKTSKLAVEIARQYEAGVFASVGLHPINCMIDLSKADEDRLEELDIEKYRELAKMPKVVAIGEIGLDYWNEPKGKEKARIFKEKQKEVFLAQLNLAQELNLPVIFHCRKAHNDLIEILKSKPLHDSHDRENRVMVFGELLRGVVHCFTGDWGQAKEYLDMGLYLGFNGIIFKFAPYRTAAGGTGAGMDLDEIIKKIPLDRILVETDCPFLVPAGINMERNEPANVKYVAQRIAEIRGEAIEKIAEATAQNAKNLFKI